MDPSGRAALEARINASPELRARLERVRARVESWDAAPVTRSWRLPPPGQRLGSLRVVAEAPAVYGRPLAPGEEVQLRLEGLEGPEDARVIVVLRRDDGDWRCVFPRGPQDLLPVSELPRDQDGVPVVGLTIAEQAGVQRWAVVLAPLPFRVDWSLPDPDRWTALIDGVDQGEVEAVSVDLEVAA